MTKSTPILSPAPAAVNAARHGRDAVGRWAAVPYVADVISLALGVAAGAVLPSLTGTLLR